MADEPLRLLGCGDGLLAAVGEIPAAPAIAPETLRAHDAVVRRLAGIADAVLPARFGMLARDEAALRARLAPAARGLGEALARVAGQEQMILRVFRDVPAEAVAPAVPARADDAHDATRGPGARYLTARARASREAAEIPELAALRPVLERLVTAERVERHDAPPLVASVYHLLPRGRAAAYTAAVEEGAALLPGVRVSVSGPWAPYAFAPDALE
jgi:hypothetical protein